MAFRCAAASLAESEPLLGTASTVRAFVLVEHPGAWGQEALRDARLPPGVRGHLSELSATGVKVLLIRRHGRRPASPSCHVFVAWCGPNQPWAESAVLDSVDEVAGLDLSPVSRGERVGLAPHADPVVCVCTHGRHDTCCAERGRPLARALAVSHPSLVWEVSHVGGDRFAGNVVILPDGLYYGRVTPDLGPALVEDHVGGRLDLDLLRGRSAVPLVAQAAEVFLRRRLHEIRRGAVCVVAIRRDGAVSSVDLEVDDVRWRCTVSSRRAEPQQLTCAISRLGRPPRFDEIEIRRLG